MSAHKRVILSVSTLLFSSQPFVLASEYPAPPGHYGQDKILENSTFNTGKGSPYINILPAGETLPDKKPETIQAKKTEKTISTPPESTMKAEAKPEPITKKPMQRLFPAKQALPFASPEPVAATLPVPIAEQPVYSSAPETAPSRFQEQVYPDASDLSHHYNQSGKLPFGQWGEELPETQPDIHQAPQYEYPATYQADNSRYPATPMNQNFRGSPDLANQMFNPQANRARTYNQSRKNNNSFFNPGSLPVDMMDQFWAGRNSGFMPPINNQLKTFDQFPVPQNFYGPSSINQPVQSGNRQYFRQIPKEEIIYPPHYPGNR